MSQQNFKAGDKVVLKADYTDRSVYGSHHQPRCAMSQLSRESAAGTVFMVMESQHSAGDGWVRVSWVRPDNGEYEWNAYDVRQFELYVPQSAEDLIAENRSLIKQLEKLKDKAAGLTKQLDELNERIERKVGYLQKNRELIAKKITWEGE